MSTAGGPRLAGIGRSGDSDIVLCMDAHDAGSYPGEPTTNLFPQPSFAPSAVGATWSGTNGTWGTSTATVESVMGPDGKYIKAVSNTHSASGGGAAHIWFFYHYLSGMGGAQSSLTLTNGTTYTCSWWWKANRTIQHSSSNQIYFTSPSVSTSGALNPVSSEWSKAFITFTFGGTTGTYYPGHYFYNCGDGFKVWYAMLQIEEKTYGTPAVRSQLSGFGQQGYNARPVSTDLMIHGNVGTGTTFKDSSPRKLALTNTNGVSHSAVAKFPGGSLKFVRSSTQWIQTASTDAANFGTGDWTIDYWFNMTSGQTARMHALDLGVYASSNISLDFNDGNAFWLYWNGSGGNNIIWGSDGDYGDGAWHHMAVTRRLGMIRVWVDGVHKGSNNYSSSTSMGSTTNIDIGSSGGGVLWDGYLDEIRITKGTALWSGSGNFTPPTRRNRSAPAVDLSGHDNGGNFATKDMTDVVTYRDGQVIEPVGSAVWDFDGTDDIIDLGNINYNGLPGLTVATWVYSSNFAANDSFMSSWGDNSNSNYAWLLFMSQWTSRKIDWLISSNGTGYNRCAGATALTDNLWYHVAATWTTSAMKLYLNGVEDGSQTSPSAIMNNDFNTFIGCDSDGGSESKVRFFGGEMGNATIWKTALTAAQIKQNFNAQRSRFQV